jgi:hypothetical protein
MENGGGGIISGGRMDNATKEPKGMVIASSGEDGCDNSWGAIRGRKGCGEVRTGSRRWVEGAAIRKTINGGGSGDGEIAGKSSAV